MRTNVAQIWTRAKELFHSHGPALSPLVHSAGLQVCPDKLYRAPKGTISTLGAHGFSSRRDERVTMPDRRLSHQPGDPAASTNSPFAKEQADRERCAKRDRARHGRRNAHRNPSERVGRRRGAGPRVDAPLDPAVFASSPRDHPGRRRSAAPLASNANESGTRAGQGRQRASTGCATGSTGSILVGAAVGFALGRRT